jgi:hypothetical protein
MILNAVEWNQICAILFQVHKKFIVCVGHIKNRNVRQASIIRYTDQASTVARAEIIGCYKNSIKPKFAEV